MRMRVQIGKSTEIANSALLHFSSSTVHFALSQMPPATLITELDLDLHKLQRAKGGRLRPAAEGRAECRGTRQTAMAAFAAR